MRILNRFALAALAALVVAAALTPAQAICGGNPIIRTYDGFYGNPDSFVWNPAVFTPGYYPGYPVFGLTPPWGPDFVANFWALNTGDPVSGVGDDAGLYTVPPAGWAYYGPTYYGSYQYAGVILGGWGLSAAIDGCVQNNPPNWCTCVLLSDQDGVNGYYAILANNATTGTWITELAQPGTDAAGNAAAVIMAPIPAPVITNAVRKAGLLDLDITVTVPGPLAGDYTLGTCEGCAPHFKLMQAIVARGAPPPADRVATAWSPMNLVGGTPMPEQVLGSSVTVESLCGGSDQDVYIATQLVFDPASGGGFSAPVVSSNSTRIECGPNLAEPEKPRFRPGTQQGPRPTRQRQR